MCKQIKYVLQTLKNDFGFAIFTNPQQFKAALADTPIVSDAKKIRNLLNIAIDNMKAYSRLESALAGNNPFIIDNLVSEMVNDCWPERSSAQIAIECIAELLGYNFKPSINESENTSKIAKSSSTNTAPVVLLSEGRWKTGDIIQFGSYNWRVLDVQNNKALILTEKIIEERAYNNEYKDVTWETCTLRKYLNNEFLSKFTGEDQRRIEETRIINRDNLKYGTKGGENTIDKVFILSLEEADKYFGDSGERIAKFGSEACWWWLRSPGNGRSAAYVRGGGDVLFGGSRVDYGGGVRPALWLRA